MFDGWQAPTVNGFWMGRHRATNEGPRPVRLAFARTVSTPEEARAVLISMLKDARSKLG